MKQIIASYLIRRISFGWTIVFSIACLLVLSVDSVMQLEVSSDAGVSTLVAFALAVLHLPILVEATMPFVFLFGTMIAFQLLNRRSELVVLRASGISAWYFVLVPSLFAGLVGIFFMLVANPMSAQLNAIYEERKAELENSPSESLALTDNGLWMRKIDDGKEIIVHAKDVDESQFVMQDVIIWQNIVANEGHFSPVRRLDAKFAEIRNVVDANGLQDEEFLQLTSVWETRSDAASVFMESLALPTAVDSELFFSRYANPDNLSFYRLFSAIRIAHQSGFNAAPFQVKLWSLFALPMLFAAMTMIAGVLSISFQRQRRYVRMGLLAALVGIIMFFTNSLLNDFAQSGLIPTMLAPFVAPICVILLSLSILAWTEDG